MSVVPASSTLAMFGWSIKARACRSASNRAITWLDVHARLDDLEGDLAADRLLLLGHVDDAHAPLADLLEQLVGADARARPFEDGTGSGPTRGRGHLRWRRGRRPAMSMKVPAWSRALSNRSTRWRIRVAAARLFQEGGPLGRVGLLQGVEEDRAFGSWRMSPLKPWSVMADSGDGSILNATSGAESRQEFLATAREGGSGQSGGLDLAAEPGAGIAPEAVGRARRDAEELGGLGDREPGEIAELDQLGRGGVGRGEPVEGRVDGQQLVDRTGLRRGDLGGLDARPGPGPRRA